MTYRLHPVRGGFGIVGVDLVWARGIDGIGIRTAAIACANIVEPK